MSVEGVPRLHSMGVGGAFAGPNFLGGGTLSFLTAFQEGATPVDSTERF